MPGTTGHPAYANVRTHWWDVSFVYGSDEETLKITRTWEGGKINAGADGLLDHNPDGSIVTGSNKNSWVGVSLLQAVFSLEHNSIAEEMAAAHPAWSGERSSCVCVFVCVCWCPLQHVVSSAIVGVHGCGGAVSLPRRHRFLNRYCFLRSQRAPQCSSAFLVHGRSGSDLVHAAQRLRPSRAIFFLLSLYR